MKRYRCLLTETANFEEFHRVKELIMNVSTYLDLSPLLEKVKGGRACHHRTINDLDVSFFDVDFTCFQEQALRNRLEVNRFSICLYDAGRNAPSEVRQGSE